MLEMQEYDSNNNYENIKYWTKQSLLITATWISLSECDSYVTVNTNISNKNTVFNNEDNCFKRKESFIKKQMFHNI